MGQTVESLQLMISVGWYEFVAEVELFGPNGTSAGSDFAAFIACTKEEVFLSGLEGGCATRARDS